MEVDDRGMVRPDALAALDPVAATALVALGTEPDPVSGGPALAHSSSIRPVETERRREMLASRLRLHEAALAALGEGLVVVEPATGSAVGWQVVAINPAGRTLFGLTDQAFLDRLDHAGLTIGDQPACDLIATVADQGTPERRAAITIAAPAGRSSTVDLSVVPLLDRAIALIASDVGRQQELTQQLLARVELDGLTGLLNRTGFERAFDEIIAVPGPVAVLLIDLDGLKQVNDALGPKAGDLLLVEVANRLVGAMVDREALVARLGGDEFAVVIRGGLADAEKEAERLQNIISSPISLLEVTTGVGCSIGLAARPFHAKSAEDLLRAADVAMYAAKETGSSIIVAGSGTSGDSYVRVELAGRVDEGFAQGWFELYAQPIVDLQTGVVKGCEALARWADPVYGVLPPGIFLDVLRVAGKLPALTRAMISQALSLCRADRFVSVNLGDQDFRTPALMEMLTAAVEGIDGRGRLWLELTETDLEEVGVAPLYRYLDAGFELAIDDFGTGFSSLARLQQVPVSVVKLDRSLLCDSSPRALTLLRSVVDLVHALDAVVVAEGIEDAEMAARAVDTGCDLGQGFFYGRPTPLSLSQPLLGGPTEVTIDQWPVLG